MTITQTEVRCPVCAKKGFIDVDLDELKKVERGLMAINVAAHSICDHTFIAYVDKNLNIRDCYTADFQISVPQKEEKDSTAITSNLDIIKLSYSENFITNLLRAVLFNKKVLVLTDQINLASHINDFFKFIAENTFKFDIQFKVKKYYQDNKKELKDYIVFDSNKLIQDKDKVMDQKKLKEEKRIIQKFFEEKDLLSGLIIIKNEIQKIYEMTNILNKYIKENKDKKSLNSKLLIDKLEGSNIKVTTVKLNFLLDIIENYFGTEFKISETSDFLGFL